MSTFLASYYKNHSVGLCNYLKVLFSCYRVNKIIHGDKVIPCADKEFGWIFSMGVVINQ